MVWFYDGCKGKRFYLATPVYTVYCPSGVPCRQHGCTRYACNCGSHAPEVRHAA